MEELQIRVTAGNGDLGGDVTTYLREKVGAVLRLAPGPVLLAKAYVDVAADPAVERPVEIRAALDLNGHLVRAHVTAATPREAVDLLEETLRHELEQLSERYQARRKRPAATPAGGWRHGDLPTPRPPHFPRPAEERHLVARRTWADRPMTVAEAFDEMDLLGHDHLLFVELETGEDAVVSRDPDGALVVAIVGAAIPDTEDVGAPVAVRPVPLMEVLDAVATLDAGGLPHVAFVAAQSGRGAVVHLRYDGHLGLVTAV